jgi:DNA-binding GntR family transcriptional regulator
MAPKSVFFSKSDYAYAELKRLIVQGKLAPASKLDLEVLAQTLAVGRMPLREALHRLRSQGLVEIHPQRATQVAPLSIADMVDTYDARCALEGLMAERVVTLARPDDIGALSDEVDRQAAMLESGELESFLDSDRAFHYRLFEIAEAPRTFGFLRTLRDVSERYIHLYLTNPQLQASSVAEHREIVELCAAGDSRGLVEAVRIHVVRGKERLLDLLPRLIDRDDEAVPAADEG